MKGPAWLYEVAKDSALNARDVCAILKVSLPELEWKITAGRFPECDFKVTIGTSNGTMRARKREWYVRTVIKHLRTLPG